MNEIAQYIADNAKGNFEYSEATIVYSLAFSKDFKAANMNIVKCSLDCIRSVITTCGLGPRVADHITTLLIPKVFVF